MADPRGALQQPVRAGRRYTRAWVLAAAVLVLLVAGAAVFAVRAGQSDRGSAAGGSRGIAPADPPDAPLPGAVSGFGAICGGRYFAGAAPYGGAGPHPVFFAGDFTPSNELDSVPAVWLTEDVTKVQLTVCVTHTVGPVARTCDYAAAPGAGRQADVSVSLRYGHYRLVVFEARTRRQVGDVAIKGEGLICAERVDVQWSGDSSPPAQLSTLLPYQVTQALARYIN